MKVLVTREIPEEGLQLLRQRCQQLDVNTSDHNLTPEQLRQRCVGKDGVLCMLSDRIDAELMDAAPTVRCFANYAVGIDNIDIDAATRRGIVVTNTPGVLTDATAELAWALLFAAARRVVEGDRMVREGRFKGWEPMLLRGWPVRGTTLGIIGAGRIGTAMALGSAGFGMKVLYCSRHENRVLEEKLSARRVGLERLLTDSDYISLHVPLTKQTYHMIGPKELELPKPTAILINTSRGAVIDEAALVQALRDKRIAAAGLDVYEHEPRLTEGLADCPNAVLLPHLGSATYPARRAMAVMAAENLLAALTGRRPRNCVNPEALERSKI